MDLKSKVHFGFIALLVTDFSNDWQNLQKQPALFRETLRLWIRTPALANE